MLMSDMVVHGQNDYSVHYKGTFALGLEFFDVSFYNSKYGVNEKYNLQGLVKIVRECQNSYRITYKNGTVLLFWDDRGWEMIFNPEKMADGMYAKAESNSTHLEVYFTHSAAFGFLVEEQLGVMYNNFA